MSKCWIVLNFMDLLISKRAISSASLNQNRKVQLSDSPVEEDRDAGTVGGSSFLGGVFFTVAVDLLALSNFERQSSGDAANEHTDALAGSQVSDGGEGLIESAVNVHSGGDGEDILGLDLSLSGVGGDVQLSEDVRASVETDNEVLDSRVALVVFATGVRHTVKEVEDEAGRRVKLSVVLLDMGAGSEGRKTQLGTSGLELVMGISSLLTLVFGESSDTALVVSESLLGVMSVGKIVASLFRVLNVVVTEGQVTEFEHVLPVEGSGGGSQRDSGESERSSHIFSFFNYN